MLLPVAPYVLDRVEFRCIGGKELQLQPAVGLCHEISDQSASMTLKTQRQKKMVQEYFRQLPRSYLYYGFTTLVDTAVIDQHVVDDFRHAPLNPDLCDGGKPLPFGNGYPMSFVPPEVRFKEFPNVIFDAKQANRIPPECMPEDHTPAADVERVRSSGGIRVKTYFERGFADDVNLAAPI